MTGNASPSSARLEQLARTGGFVVEPAAGDRMIRALNGMIDSLESRWAALQGFQDRPPMSDSPSARWVADHMVRTAIDANGLLTQLQAARVALPSYVEAITLAQRDYHDADHDIGQHVLRPAAEKEE